MEMGVHSVKLFLHILSIRNVNEGKEKGLQLLRKTKIWRPFWLNFITVDVDFPDGMKAENF